MGRPHGGADPKARLSLYYERLWISPWIEPVYNIVPLLVLLVGMSRRNRAKTKMPKGRVLVVGRIDQPCFVTAALEARRALHAVESQVSGTSESAMADAQQRIVANLAGLAECVGNMAVTGLLNVDVSARALQTTTRLVDGAWTSQTSVTRQPPRACLDVRLDPALCNAVMQALVVLDAVDADPEAELVEVRQLAAVLASDWPDASAVDAEFDAAMRALWNEIGAPISPTSSHTRLARALTERIRCVVKNRDPADTSGLDGLRRTVESVGSVVERPR